MYLFDTDHITALDRGGEEGERLRTRLAHVPPEEAAVSVVSYEEQMRGWLAYARAAEQFQRLWVARIRIGTMDLKIAAIALANDAILLSRNLTDFSKVPALRVEDWMR